MTEWRYEDLAIVIPMLRRPHRVEPVLASARTATPGAKVLFACSSDDAPVIEAVQRTGAEMITLPLQLIGDYAIKINTGYRHTTEPLIFTGADDLEFHPGWFEAAIKYLTPGIGVVGTNDLGSPRVMAGDHATHFLVTREYADKFGTIDQPGAIFHEGYVHEWVDNECIDTARFRGAWAMALDSHVRHRHPNWDASVPMDEIYAGQRKRMMTGRPVYDRRKSLWNAA